MAARNFFDDERINKALRRGQLPTFSHTDEAELAKTMAEVDLGSKNSRELLQTIMIDAVERGWPIQKFLRGSLESPLEHFEAALGVSGESTSIVAGSMTGEIFKKGADACITRLSRKRRPKSFKCSSKPARISTCPAIAGAGHWITSRA